MWCIAELDAEYIAKMEDVLALSERAYDAREPVVCLDEKPVSLSMRTYAPTARATRPRRPTR
ncbi:MAG: hypothetical protein ACT4P6_16855 [Gemmatimonadaceae bacterium]